MQPRDVLAGPCFISVYRMNPSLMLSPIEHRLYDNIQCVLQICHNIYTLFDYCRILQVSTVVFQMDSTVLTHNNLLCVCVMNIFNIASFTQYNVCSSTSTSQCVG